MKKDIYVDVELRCPDGLCESLGYNLPSEIDSFIEFVNEFSKKKEYIIKLKRTSTLELLAKFENELRKEK